MASAASGTHMNEIDGGGPCWLPGINAVSAAVLHWAEVVQLPACRDRRGSRRCDRPPTHRYRRNSRDGPCRSRSRGRSGGALSGILFLTLASARRQYFAGRVSAGRASISDEPLHFLERLNPGNLLHRSLAAWTADRVLLCGVRPNKPQLSAPTLKLVNARTFPLYTPRLFAAMPIRSYLGGQLRSRDHPARWRRAIISSAGELTPNRAAQGDWSK